MKGFNQKLLSKGFNLLIQNPSEFSKKLYRLIRPMRKDYRKRFRMSLKQWIINHQMNVIQCHWMGVRALKNPLDAWIYQEIIYEVKPDVIVEIGSAEGGSTLFFANLLDILNKGMVISIDIDRSSYNIRHKRIIALTGDSSSEGIISKVFELCKGKKVIVFHDGCHDKEKVLKDLNAYSKLVSFNSYLVVEDGIMDLFRPGNGIGSFKEAPLAAIEEFLKNNHGFVVDSSRERYILTYNPKGFLRKIR